MTSTPTLAIKKTEGQNAFTVSLPVHIGGFNQISFEVSGVTEHDAISNLELAVSAALEQIRAYTPSEEPAVEVAPEATPDAPVEEVPAEVAPVDPASVPAHTEVDPETTA